MRTIRSFTRPTETWNPATDRRDAIRYVDVSAVSRETLNIEPVAAISAKDAPSRARKIVQANDTIFATIRPALKRIAKVPRELDNEIVSTAFCVLRPDTEQVDPDYLFFLTSSNDFVASVAEHETGASYPAVRERDVLDQEVELPSLGEQQKIAEVLNELRKSLLNEVELLSAAQKLKQAAMRELFTRGLRGEAQKETEIGPVPESWEIVRVGEQSLIISKGSSPKWQGFNYTRHGVLFVRSQNVGDGFMDWHDKAFLPLEWNEKEKRSILKSEDVLINLVGASIGRSAVGGDEIEDANCNQAVCFVRLRQENVLPRFLNGFLLTMAGQRQIHGSKKDIARANLSLEDVRQLLVPRPSLDEQKEIVCILDALDCKISLHRQKRQVLEELFQSLLHKLMTGEIRVSELDLSALSTKVAV